MSEQNGALSLIARIAGRAIEKQREQRRETGVSCSDGSIQALLLYLTVIERLARGALPETEQALLPPDETPDLVRRLAQEILEGADECLRKRRVVH
jgi:hypothetical protein